MTTEREIINRLKEMRSKTHKNEEASEKQQAEINKCKTEWTVFWRDNPHLYLKYKLMCNTYDFQAISYFLMSQSTNYNEISSRGCSKTYRQAVWAIQEMLLKPNTEIVVTSATFKQSLIIIEEKIVRELFEKGDISPVLHWMYKQGYFVVKYKDQAVEVSCTLNNSKLTAVACLDSSRGLRANVLMFDERLLLKEGLINSIFKPMRRPRQAGFLNRPAYQNENKDKYLEEPKTMSISSNRFTQEPVHREFVKCYEDALQHPNGGSRVCSFDIFTAMKHGIKTKQQFLEDRKFMDEISFKTEVLNVPISEADGAFFQLSLFRENQNITNAFRPPTRDEYIRNEWSWREKYDGEKRFVFADLAFAGEAKGKTSQVDLTAMGCISLYKSKDRWVCNLDYIKSYGGGDPNTALYLRELVYFYKADYLLVDMRNGGDALFTQLSSPMQHPFVPIDEWTPNGLTVCNEQDLMFNVQGVIDELRGRTVDSQAIPIIIPMKAGTDVNHDLAMNMYSMLKNHQINLPIDDLDFVQKQEETKEWYNLDSEQKAIRRIPYMETRLLVNEAIKLKATYSGAKVKLIESSYKDTKDRVYAFGYGLLLCQKIINKQERLANNPTEIDWGSLILSI